MSEEELDVDGPPRDLLRSFALGFVAMAPLLFLYELAVESTGGSMRNTSELALSWPSTLFAEHVHLVRRVALAVLVVAALVLCARRHWQLGPRLMRLVGEGAVGAVVLGPALVLLLHWIGHAPTLGAGSAPRPAPGLALAGLVLGAGAYEEILFRVGLYSALYVLGLQVVRFLGLGELSRPASEVLAVVGSALVFAAFHLRPVVRWLGAGGEEFDLAIFTYRFLAGILLGALYRWRGPGVAAWTHGLYNLALLCGAGPHVFL